MIENLGGRKFILAVLSISAAAAMVIAGYSLSTELVTLMLGVVTAFTVGNGYTKKVMPKRDPMPVDIPASDDWFNHEEVFPEVQESGATAVDLSEVNEKLDKLTAATVSMTQAIVSIQEDSAKATQILTNAMNQGNRNA